MRLSRLLLLAATFPLVARVTASCSDFGEDPPPDTSTVDAGEDVAPADSRPPVEDAGADAAADARPELPSSCPPSKAFTTPPSALSKTVIGSVAGGESYPFGIALDPTHITWIEQPAAAGAASGDAPARVIRAAKKAPYAPYVVADTQPAAVAIALDGDEAFWVTWSMNTATLMRASVAPACNPVICPAVPVKVIAVGSKVVRLLRYASRKFIALSNDGTVIHLDLGPTPEERVIAKTNDPPGLAITSQHLYMSTETDTNAVARAPFPALSPVDRDYFAVPKQDGGRAGVAPLATDCSALFMARYFPSGDFSRIYRHDLSTPASTALLDFIGTVSDLAADAGLMYIASRTNGLFARDPKLPFGGAIQELETGGGVERVAVDDSGVYFGVYITGQQATVRKIAKP